MPTGMDAILNAGGQVASEATMGSFGDFLVNKASMMPAINTDMLSSLAGLGGKLWDVAGSQQVGNALSGGSAMFNAFNQYKLGKDSSRILKSQEARAADAYARDKEADAKRQLLTF